MLATGLSILIIGVSALGYTLYAHHKDVRAYCASFFSLAAGAALVSASQIEGLEMSTVESVLCIGGGLFSLLGTLGYFSTIGNEKKKGDDDREYPHLHIPMRSIPPP